MVDYIFQNHGLVELWDFPLLGILVIVGIVYVVFTGSFNHLNQGIYRITFKQKSYFLLGSDNKSVLLC
ncbi:hypothetical protein [Bacillus solitudinis]|uniref:hypothetical protein n=1 Tax=Bacillus solitudinis TaxID=2014074 RepID=UPI000C240800|nr:hypothetical protein [Bacillus solitudinis]